MSYNDFDSIARLMRTLAILAALCCTQAHAYLGTFDPVPYRNVATIKFIDSQFAGALVRECIK